MKIKICGMRRIEDIEMINQFNIDYAGFIFYPKSFRYVDALTVKELGKHLTKAKKVGVFVNEELDKVIEIANTANLDIIQLHGEEDQIYIDTLKKKCKQEIWKALRIRNKEDLKGLALQHIDHFLLDSFTKEYGGSGKTFNHELLNNIDLSNIFIAGGINKENIKHILSYSPYGVDISSSIETNQYKDINKLKEIMEELQ